MSINPYKPHLLVLPEDDANREIANGFTLEANLNSCAFQVLPPAGGWMKVVEKFTSDHASAMEKYTERRMVLLVDFDDKENRKKFVDSRIPTAIKARVYVLGPISEPEKLRNASGKKFEAIGATLAKDCTENRQDFWMHDLLKHNKPELDRLIQDVKPFLFG